MGHSEWRGYGVRFFRKFAITLQHLQQQVVQQFGYVFFFIFF